tara:strand:+ start:286 stop:519 length:234 start_codon:yes stop_codon:yes gene_type:complete
MEMDIPMQESHSLEMILNGLMMMETDAETIYGETILTSSQMILPSVGTVMKMAMAITPLEIMVIGSLMKSPNGMTLI